jgi:hypothetical protein
VTKTHSRPHVSNDNPFSESHFKTLKYRPEFPDRFGSIQDSRIFCQQFFAWYNTAHHHSAIGWLTPQVVHYGQAAEVSAATGKPILTATELAIADADNAGPAAVRASGRVAYASADRAVRALEHLWLDARFRQRRATT